MFSGTESTMEIKLDSAGKSGFYAEIKSIPVYNNKETVQFCWSVVRDITERKLAEEKLRSSLSEKEVLIREVHHRVKNNMAVIISLLRLQERSIKDDRLKTVFQESQSRINSMALIHETLYQSELLSEINLQSYLNKLSKIF